MPPQPRRNVSTSPPRVRTTPPETPPPDTGPVPPTDTESVTPDTTRVESSVLTDSPTETAESSPTKKAERKYVSHEDARRTALGSNAMFLALYDDEETGLMICDSGSTFAEVSENAREDRAFVVMLPLVADYRVD